MIDIEQVIEQFDEHIDNGHVDIPYSLSEMYRNHAHSSYCRQLDKFIQDRFERIDDDYYRSIDHD